ncbi:unnamed protein product [Adineta steineri]|uniref:Tubby C-terminal domain-containing protein n=1 Tax=Adineta steineri TaxID=433720 RepID=A0A819TFX5_9BILA|nr:unnamed protein product [Adineta steineri]CAF4078470.1 unnamed protein product [Adineta steineri]
MTQTESKTIENLTDDDDDQLNSSNKIIPTAYKSNQSELNEEDTSKINNQSDFDIQNLIKLDLKNFINKSIPKEYENFIQCHIKREKDGFSTIYSLYYIGQNENDLILLLKARKHVTIGGHSEFLLEIPLENSSTNLNDETSIAKLRSIKILQHEYVLYDYQNNQENKPQILAIIYDEHKFGSKESRKFTVLLHNTKEDLRQFKENETIIDEWRAGRSNDLIEIKNKIPTYNQEFQVYSLPMLNNHIKEGSHKNFQLIYLNEHNEEDIIMEFGRINENRFSLDYRYPLTTIEAFSIALSSFHNRFRT